MTDIFYEMQKEAAEARIGADRMAMGLSCIPDPLRGDMAEIAQLRAAIAYMRDHADAPVIIRRETRRALEPKP